MIKRDPPHTNSVFKDLDEAGIIISDLEDFIRRAFLAHQNLDADVKIIADLECKFGRRITAVNTGIIKSINGAR